MDPSLIVSQLSIVKIEFMDNLETSRAELAAVGQEWKFGFTIKKDVAATKKVHPFYDIATLKCLISKHTESTGSSISDCDKVEAYISIKY